jgi:hypothetical protein
MTTAWAGLEPEDTDRMLSTWRDHWISVERGRAVREVIEQGRLLSLRLTAGSYGALFATVVIALSQGWWIVVYACLAASAGLWVYGTDSELREETRV